MQDVVDYSIHFPDALIAQGKGHEFLALYKRDNPIRRYDGKMASFEVINRALSAQCNSESDGAYARVQCSDVSYWQAKELNGVLQRIKQGKDVNLFEEFRLFC